MGKSTLQQRVEQANKAGRIARIPFITAGFPTKAQFVDILRELDAHGADVIEVGVPFSDPVADGPMVEAASRIALEQGVTLPWILEQLAGLTPRLKAGVVLMGYYNPFLQYGLERLAADVAKAGVEGFIVPDLPLGEDAPMRAALHAHSLDLIPLVGLNTSEERMREYAATASGYVYVVSVMGTTGGTNSMNTAVEDALERVSRVFTVPVALGFGIQNPQQLASLRVKPQAAVFGSALLRHLEAGGTVAAFMKPWEE